MAKWGTKSEEGKKQDPTDPDGKKAEAKAAQDEKNPKE